MRAALYSILIVLLVQAPAVVGAPVVPAGGAVNAASYAVASFPYGSIAQGSIFTIFGQELGPGVPIAASQFPLATELGGVTVSVSRGGSAVQAVLLYVSTGQINALMPSDAPLGEAELVVRVNGAPSAPIAVEVVRSSFGAFTPNNTGSGPGWTFSFNSASDQPQNTPLTSSRPGQYVTVWGTGLGPVPGVDNVRPSDVLPLSELDLKDVIDIEVYVGNVPVTDIYYAGRSPEYPGLDQLIFLVPDEAPRGCWAPVIVSTDDISAPAFTMAIADDGGACSDSANPFSQLLVRGGDFGALLMVRASGGLTIPGLGQIQFVWDLFAGNFASRMQEASPYHLLMALPPLGACTTATVRGLDLVGVLGGQFPDIVLGEELEGAPALTLTRQADNLVVEVPRQENRYVQTVGGGLPIFGPPKNPPFFNPGTFTISGAAGAQVGPVNVNVSVPVIPTWANPEALATVDRSRGATFRWEGGDPLQVVALAGANVQLQSGAVGAFYCLLPQQLGSFTVPPAVLNSVPPTDGANTLGFVGFGVIPAGNIASFVDGNQPPSLDAGVAMPIMLNLRSGAFQ